MEGRRDMQRGLVCVPLATERIFSLRRCAVFRAMHMRRESRGFPEIFHNITITLGSSRDTA